MNTVHLDTLCTDIIDCPHETPEWLREGIFVVRNYNLIDGEVCEQNASYVDEQTYIKRTRRAIPANGDIVISREAPMGVVGMIPPGMRCCLGQRLVLLKVNKELCSADYLLFVLQSNYVQSQIKQVDKTGSIVSNLNIPVLRELNIPYLDVKKQVRTGVVLKKISEKIALNKRINSELEAMAKTLYDYWFVQFDFPDENGKPYRTSGGAMEWNEQLKREIPKGWKVEPLKGKFNIERGITYTSENIESGVGIPMLNLACINTNRKYRDGELKYYKGAVSDKDKLSAGDLLIACTDLTRNADIVGCPILVPADGQEYTFSMDLAKLIPFEKVFNRYYLHSTLQTDYYHNYIKKWASGTNVLHLDLSGIDWYMTWIPPKQLQDKYGELNKGIQKRNSSILRENRELSQLRDWLLPMLMNGQATVADEESTDTVSNVVELPKDQDERFSCWLQNQSLAARGEVDMQTLREIFDAMDDDDK